MAVTRLAALALAALAMLGVSNASAQNWPNRSVKLIVPLSAGTATDVTARLYAEKLSQRWHQPVVVENRPGPDALVAVAAFTGAHDDHTLLFSFGGPVTINPVTRDKLPYDPEHDLVPIVAGTDSFLAFAAAASLRINSLIDLARRARAEPSKLNWAATPGMPQFAFRGFVKSAGLDMVEVSYREFGPALQDVSEARITAVGAGLLPLAVLEQSGKVKVIAVTNRVRSPASPQYPTAVEQGFPDVIAEGFQGFFGWRDMPTTLRDQIAADVRAVAPELPGDRLAAMGQMVRTGTTADFVAMIADQRARIQAVAGDIKK